MGYNTLKKDLVNTIEKINHLPNDFNVFNVQNTKNKLLHYMIFFEEFEQQRNNGSIKIKDIQEECRMIQATLKIINDNC